jgi:hypothetical protein
MGLIYVIFFEYVQVLKEFLLFYKVSCLHLVNKKQLEGHNNVTLLQINHCVHFPGPCLKMCNYECFIGRRDDHNNACDFTQSFKFERY